MNNKIALFTAALMTATWGSAQAGQDVFHDYARVIDVKPIVTWREVPVERRICKPDRRRGHHRNDRRRDDYLVPTVLGGAVGGAIGSQVEDRGARVVTTATGSVVGAMAGYGLSQVSDDHDRHQRKGHRRCRTVTEYRRESHVEGYRVTYRYHGHEFTTRTEEHPGRRLALKVKVRPVY